MQQKLFIGRNISEETRTWLSTKNIDFEDHQLIQIELCEPDFALFSTIKIKPKMWVISSQWAAKWLLKYHAEIGFGILDSIVCLSEKQKEICKVITRNISVSNQQNAVWLSKMAFGQNKGQSVIYLHGNLSNHIFENEFDTPEKPFHEVEVYRNSPILKQLGNFEVYLFFSPSGVINFVEGGNFIPAFSQIVAIGSTTAKTCKEIFQREVFTSEVQEELAAVKCAVQILQLTEIYSN